MYYQGTRQTFRDKTLRCCDCGESFIWTAGEQAFYFSKSLSQPKRDKSCRELRRRTKNPNADTHWESTMAKAREEIQRGT